MGERNQCRLDDPVSKFLPEFSEARVCAQPKRQTEASPNDKAPKKMLTLRRLLTHSSGIGYGAVLGSKPDGAAEEAYVGIVEGCDSGRIASLKQLCL